MILFEILARNSYGKWHQSAVIPSVEVTAREPHTYSYERASPITPTVLTGSKTANGNPILCNDPHLALNLPSIWFEIQLCTPEFNTYGASLPGAPGVISGFNENIAWGETNVGHDMVWPWDLSRNHNHLRFHPNPNPPPNLNTQLKSISDPQHCTLWDNAHYVKCPEYEIYDT